MEEMSDICEHQLQHEVQNYFENEWVQVKSCALAELLGSNSVYVRDWRVVQDLVGMEVGSSIVLVSLVQLWTLSGLAEY